MLVSTIHPHQLAIHPHQLAIGIHISREGNGTPLQYSCLENPMDGGAWKAAVHWGRWGSDTTERLHLHFSLSCSGEGNGNPLQCSCLENPRDGEAWWAAIYGVAQSRTRLKWLSSSIHISPLSWTSLPTPTSSHPSRLSQSPGFNSLHHTANFHWLSILHMVVYMFPWYFLHLSHPLIPCQQHVHKSIFYVYISILDYIYIYIYIYICINM